MRQAKTGGMKSDQGKPQWSLLPGDVLTELVKVYMLGVKKYARDNWRQGMDWDRIFDAGMRHAWAWWEGEERDPVDGQPHLISAAWCFLTLFWYSLHKKGKDTRYREGK